MKAYKGFDKDMKCRGFQFKEGETYEEPEAMLCKKGFHACEAPLDCFAYYAPSDSEYHEVELEDVTSETSTDSKRVGRKIKIGAKLSIRDLVSAQFEFVNEHCTNENNAEDGQPASAGAYGAASAGFRGAASAGDSGAAVSRGRSSVGKNGIACVRGNDIYVKGDIGAILIIAVENDSDYNIKEWKAAVVDGETIKPDVWYTLKYGEFTEVKDE